MRNLLLVRNSDWLQAQRSQFVASNGSAARRNSLTAGRTGTRLNIGKPQARWDAGISLARVVLGSRSDSLSGSHSLSIGSRIRNAVAYVTEYLTRDPG